MKLKEHIRNLKELKRLTCMDCEMRKAKVSCCTSKIDDFRLCCYIVSLNFAIDLLKELDKK